MSNRGNDDDASAAFASALEGALAESQPPRVVAPANDALALVIINGPSLGRVLPLTGTQPLTIGRAPTCNLPLADQGVSRVHMLITPRPEGWVVQDERSAGGSFLNGQRFQRTVLKLNDKLQIGSSTIFAVRRVDDTVPRTDDYPKHDPLTGLLNKKTFASLLKVAFPAALATNEPLTVALTNLDHFMRFNDQHGHVAGDNALLGIVDHVRRSLPPACVVARYSGDGFAMVIPRTTLVDARALLEPMRAAVGPMHPFVHGREHFRLSMSIGFACVPDATVATPNVKSLVVRADEQLYDAKRNGRDRMRPIV